MFSDVNWEEEFKEKGVEGKWQVLLHCYNSIPVQIFDLHIPSLS